MTKTIIFAISGSFVGGAAVGFIAGYFFKKKKYEQRCEERIQQAVDLYNEYLDEAYSAMEEDLEDPDEMINPVVQEREERRAKEREIYEKAEAEMEDIEKVLKNQKEGIELLKAKDWESEVEDLYSKEELWFFPDDLIEGAVLADEDGNVLEPREKYVGDWFTKVGFLTNRDSELYILNHNLMKKYLIHKESDISRDSFFNY